MYMHAQTALDIAIYRMCYLFPIMGQEDYKDDQHLQECSQSVKCNPGQG